jgi:hypothetical protein
MVLNDIFATHRCRFLLATGFGLGLDLTGLTASLAAAAADPMREMNVRFRVDRAKSVTAYLGR